MKAFVRLSDMKKENTKVFPQRKRTRLKNFDYSTNGMYFVTICTKEKQKILWATNDFAVNDGCGAVGANSVRPHPSAQIDSSVM